MINQQQNLERYINIFLLIFCIYFLFPLLQSGYISDDAYNSLIKGSILEKNKDFFNYVIELNWGWLSNSGRLYPVEHFSQTLIFYFIQNVKIFKILKLLSILFSIYYFRLNVSLISNSKNIANFSILILLIFFQFRQWHDPVLGFAILIPLICLFFFSSLYYFQLFLKSQNKKNLVVSVLLYCFLILTYEISYLLIFVYIFIAFIHSRKIPDLFSKLKFHYLFLFIAIIVTIYFRFNVGDKSYPSLDQSFSIFPFFQSLGIQIYSGVSFSYFIRLKSSLIDNLEIIDLLLISYPLLIYKILIEIDNKNFKVNLFFNFLIIGLIIVISQSFMVAISGHKNDLINMGLGFGYLPVMLQYFGFTLIYISLFLLIIKKIEKLFFKKLILITFGILITINGLINISNNRYVVNETNKFYKYPRELLKKSLINEESKIKEADIIIRSWRYPHDINWFYSNHTNKLFCIIDFNKSINESDFSWPNGCAFKKLNFKGNKIVFDVSEVIYSISYNFDDTGNQEGELYFAKIDQIIIDEQSKKIFELTSKELSVYNESENKFKNFDFENNYNFVDIIKQDSKKKNEVKIPFL
mgnify:CR=1 FL=1